jgi:hypothetical protein
MEYPVSGSRERTNQVNIWLAQAAKGLPRERLLQLSEMAMAALWQRAYLTLGEITLAAITDRVLSTTAEKFPAFKSLKVTSTGIDWRGLREQHELLKKRELTDGIQFLIAEFMVVVGNLTAEILRPALQTELLKVTLKRQEIDGKQGERQS